MFLRWCVRVGEADPQVLEAIAGRDNPLRKIPRFYGKVQAKNPARWLTYDEAYGRLLGTCDLTDFGLRDALVLRLGLSGMRLSEVLHLTVGAIRLGESPPRVAWIGKGRRPRQFVPGPGGGHISWGNQLKQPCSIQRIVLEHAQAAGLGHLHRMICVDQPRASSTAPRAKTARATSTCSTYNASSVTAIRQRR